MLESKLAKSTPPLLQEYHRKRKILFTQSRAAANPALALRLQFTHPARRVAELGSLGLKLAHMSSLGVFASVFDATGRILLVRQAYGSRHWTTPRGRVEVGESPLAALGREILEEIACGVRITHLIGVYTKPYRDDLVLSFAAELVRRTPYACPPEISELAFFARHELPRDIAFNSRIRLEDAFERCRGVVRVLNSADCLAPSFASVCS
jgi:8-oxo-dGTP diphosphatase